MSISKFRFNKRRKHPSYVFKEKNNKYHCIIITHSKTTKSKANIPLYKNPQREKKKQAYLVPKIYKDEKSFYGKKINNFSFHKFDKRKVKHIKEHK